MTTQSAPTDAILKKRQTNRTVFNKYWIIGVGIGINHVIALLTLAFYRDVSWAIVFGAIAAGFFNMLGITAGYHRLWSHNSFAASLPLRHFLSLIGTASWQGSIRWWVLRHRMHHRFTDTKYDPYDSNRGFLFSHYGWLFEKPHFYEKIDSIDMSDLNRDPVVQFNRRYTPHGVIGMGLILPAVIGYVLGDTLGGFLYIGVMGRIISWNGIFFVNSWAHTFGEKIFNEESSATHSFLCAFFSNGEGNHSYHHEFPYDYRHGVRWFDYDPTKWHIWVWSKLRLATKLMRAPDHLRNQSEIQTKLNLANAETIRQRQKLNKHMTTAPPTQIIRGFELPPEEPLDELPVTTLEKVKATFANSKNKKMSSRVLPPSDEAVTWVQIGSLLCDVTEFKRVHPGGRTILQAYNLRDATEVFYGGRNIHTRAAQAMVKRMAIAVIKECDSDDSSTGSADSNAASPRSMLRCRSSNI